MTDNNIDESYDYLFKIVLVGDISVGKTFILSRYLKNALPKTPKPTIGVEFATRSVRLRSGRTVKAQIWDTAGQERYHAIVSAHYRRAIGALLVFDITNKRSFLNTERWISDLRKTADPDIVIMLVGNKLDLVQKDPTLRQVSTDEALKFAQEHGMLYEETSAITGTGVKEAFEHLLEEIHGRPRSNAGLGQDLGSKLAQTSTKKDSKCC